MDRARNKKKRSKIFFPSLRRRGDYYYSLRDFARRINSNPSFAVSAEEGEYEYARRRRGGEVEVEVELRGIIFADVETR